MKKYLIFLLFSYITAFIFEFIANSIGDGKLFESANRIFFFVLWYSLFYTVLYFLLQTRKIKVIVSVFAVVGIVAEIVIFHRSNLIVDPLIYALMGFISFWLQRKIFPLY